VSSGAEVKWDGMRSARARGTHHPVISAVCTAVALVLLVAPIAVAQQAEDADPRVRGEQLYRSDCALCHGESGEGHPPTFPALSGNPALEDLTHVVIRIREGQGTMPPFPDFSAEEVSAVAGYVRNAWENGFGPVSSEEAGAALAGLVEAGSRTSVWDGVFTVSQAEHGQTVYPGACGTCHGRRLNGAPDDPDMVSTPPLARAKFLRTWEGRSLAALFEYTRATMPENNPGSLTDEEYIDVIAHMLSVSGLPAGDVELEPDPQSLARVVIEQRP